jgi:hypothetical protein
VSVPRFAETPHHTDMAEDLTPEIKAEIQRALEKFGVKFLGPDERDPKGKKVTKLNLDDTSQVNRILESRGEPTSSLHYRFVERYRNR